MSIINATCDVCKVKCNHYIERYRLILECGKDIGYHHFEHCINCGHRSQISEEVYNTLVRRPKIIECKKCGDAFQVWDSLEKDESFDCLCYECKAKVYS